MTTRILSIIMIFTFVNVFVLMGQDQDCLDAITYPDDYSTELLTKQFFVQSPCGIEPGSGYCTLKFNITGKVVKDAQGNIVERSYILNWVAFEEGCDCEWRADNIIAGAAAKAFADIWGVPSLAPGDVFLSNAVRYVKAGCYTVDETDLYSPFLGLNNPVVKTPCDGSECCEIDADILYEQPPCSGDDCSRRATITAMGFPGGVPVTISCPDDACHSWCTEPSTWNPEVDYYYETDGTEFIPEPPLDLDLGSLGKRVVPNSETKGLDFEISPNPSSGEVQISLQDKREGSVVVEVFDMTGNKVYMNKSMSSGGLFQINVNLGSLTQGSYLCRVTLENNEFGSKIFVIEK